VQRFSLPQVLETQDWKIAFEHANCAVAASANHNQNVGTMNEFPSYLKMFQKTESSVEELWRAGKPILGLGASKEAL